MQPDPRLVLRYQAAACAPELAELIYAAFAEARDALQAELEQVGER
jgi:hypothetical protein